MHIWTHLKPQSGGKSGFGLYADGMVEHDAQVGQLLKKLDDLKIADNTIVIYTTDNGAEVMFWPDGGMTPLRGEKATGWEGSSAPRAWSAGPGKIKPGQLSNEVVAGEDWLPTFLAAAGVPDIKEKLLTGYKAGATTFKVHLDGYNQLPYLTAKPRSRRARSSSTSTTTAASWPSATTAGRCISRSGAPRFRRLGGEDEDEAAGTDAHGPARGPLRTRPA